MNQTPTDSTSPPITAAPEPIFSSTNDAAPDIEKYRSQIMEFDLSHDQQTELLQTLFHIMSSFVELGFDVASVQNILPIDSICTKPSRDLSELADSTFTIPQECVHMDMCAMKTGQAREQCHEC